MVLNDLAAFLVAGGMGTIGTDLFLSELPPSPDLCTALVEYAGREGLRTMAASAGRMKLEYAAVQVVVRGATYDAARTRIQAVYVALDGARFTSGGGVVYRDMSPFQPPFYLARDENQRPMLAFNCGVMKDPG